MTRALFIVISFFFVLRAHGQSSDVYSMGLKRHISEYYEEQPNILYVKSSLEILNVLDTKFEGVEIILIDDDSKLKEASKLGVTLVEMFPIFINEIISFQIVVNGTSFQKGRTRLTKSGVSYFELEMVNGKPIFTREIHRGI